MRIIFNAVPALLLAGTTAVQGDNRANALDPRAKVPRVEYRSAFDGYRPFAEPQVRDWRAANEAVGAAGGQAGHRPGQGPGQQTSKPQPGKPESSGGQTEETEGAPAHEGHGAHK
jgi:hypothetical protein